MLRRIAPGDLRALVTLYVECFNAPPWNDGWSLEAARDRIESILCAPHFRGWLSKSGEDTQGLLLGQNERWVTGYHFNLLEMCVLPKLQRSGLGTALLQQATSDLRAEGVEKLYLITAPDGPAENFYRKHGARRSGGRVVVTLDLERR